MSDDPAPYSDAIEQTAKTAGKALDLVKDAAGPIADIYGLVIGDHIGAARSRRLDKLIRKTKKILKDRDLAETAEVAEQIAIPLLEAAQREPRDEMQDLWAQLLANAMDPSRRDDVRTEFIGVLKTLHPADALVLHFLGEPDREKRYFQTANMVTVLRLRETSVVVSLRNLGTQGCIKEGNGNYTITDFGKEFLLACRP